MTEVWVDTDFGFDDLWAILLLQHYDVQIAGVSLVSGNTALPQVISNALGAAKAYGLEMPMWSGADQPLHRTQETAVRILGPTGFRTRGRQFPVSDGCIPAAAERALATWLRQGSKNQEKVVLALGPLTNLALLLARDPIAAQKITRLVWMGGSSGAGNHTNAAEFNAFADPEALKFVVDAGIPLDVVDLLFCRQVVFGEDDIPKADALTRDFLGGYLDIALERGRDGMAIYDPLAAMAVARPQRIQFESQGIDVSVKVGPSYGATRFSSVQDSHVRLAAAPDRHLTADCLAVLSREGPRNA
ncbi:MAG: nucleoside hydrolase [Roseobacter sp.]